MRKLVIRKVLDYVKNCSTKALEPIQSAAAASGAKLGEWLTREQLLTRLETYRKKGEWSGDLGDLMPQIYASFTNTPMFVIVYDDQDQRVIGYFLRPEDVFNQPTLRRAPSPVINNQRHFEPLNVPIEFMEAWEAIYDGHDPQDGAIPGIQVALTDEDLRELRGERRDARGATSAAAGITSGGDVGQKQQGEGIGGTLPGD